MKIQRTEFILYSAYASLAYVILYLTEITAVILIAKPDFLAFSILEIVLSLFVYAGWMIAGKTVKNPLLMKISLVALVMVPLIGALDMALTYFTFVPVLFSVLSSMIMGIITIVFGLGILRMKEEFGELAKTVGVFDVIMGICLFSYVLMLVAALIMPPLLVLEATLLFRVYNKANKNWISRLMFWRK